MGTTFGMLGIGGPEKYDDDECDHDYDLWECREEGATVIEVWKCNKCGLENEWVVDVDY